MNPTPARCLLLITAVGFGPGLASAVDKNGVSPQAISLPSGPGSIQGLGESFQPQLNTGEASYGVSLQLPAAAAGHRPELRLAYDAGAENGCVGLGWRLSGVFTVSRNTDHGLPRYVDGPNGVDDDLNGVADNPEEIDVFSGMDREELVPLSDGSFRAETETSFTRYERAGAGWLARRKDGTRFELGISAGARIEDAAGTFSWLLERIVDIHGNTIELEYSSHPSSAGQKYLRRIRWGQPEAAFAVVFTYEEGRPDVLVDFRAGFEVRTALRMTRIDLVSTGLPARADALRGDFDGDGKADALVRRWVLEYRANAPVSLLSRVTQLGCDGVTALRPLDLEYTSWTPPEDAAAVIVESAGEPAETLSSGSVELCDMNGDGLPDLLTTSGNTHRAAMNLGMSPAGALEWAPLQAVGNAPLIDIGSSKAHLADATADGLADLVVKVSNTRFLCFDNTSHNAWTQSAIPLRNTDTWPIWPFDGAEGVASRSIDVDHNRQNDVLFTSAAGYELWMLLPGGQYARETRPVPLVYEGQMFRFDLPGTHIADMNGDRLPDLVWVQSTRVLWFPSLGRGRFGEARVLPLGTTLLASDIEKSGFADLDDDGLMDLTIVRPTNASRSVLYWLNRFERGLDGPRRLDGLPAALPGDALRWADMNGNGSSDIVISNSARPAGSRILFVEFVPNGKPYLLSRADNGLGLVTTLEHESSVDQMVRARREGRAWSSAMQISIQVVRRVTEDDGLGHPNIREITYRDPYWNAAKQEFRGFRAVQLREVGDDTASDRITRHLYDAGLEADCMKGKLLLEEILDESGKVYSRSESAWKPRAVEHGTDGRVVCFAFAEATDSLHIEGSEAAVTTRVERDFDSLGNPTLERNLGIVDRTGDEVVASMEYELRPADWIMDRLSRKRTLDGAGRPATEERLFYDARGRLERRESWLDTGDRFIVTLVNRHDAFGNVVETTDANGHRRSWVFDDLLHAFPIREVVHLEGHDLTMSAGYDLAFGAATSAMDFAQAATSFEYDALGRLTAVRRPGGAGELHSYLLAAPVSHVLTRKIETAAGATHDSYVFSDGYGRELARKSEAGGGLWRVLDAVAFNSRKLESRRWLPWLSSASAWESPDEGKPHSVTLFDAEGRPVEKRLSDGSFERTVHEPLRSHHFDANDTQGEGLPVTHEVDGRGRLVTVIERVGQEELTTRYAWSVQDKLIEVTDAQGNVRRAAFDSLGRRTSVDDPDSGRKTFAYDDAGNLLRTVDADGTRIEYSYDFANRLVSEDFVDPRDPADPIDVRYRYDAPSEDVDLGDGTRGTAGFTGGRFAAVFDRSGEEHRSYDARGNVLWSLKRVRDPRTGALAGFTTRFERDLLDRLVGLTYPDGDGLRLAYDEATLLARADGGPQGRVVVERFDYSGSAQPARIEWGNGVVTELGYDERDRVRSIRIAGPAGDVLLDDAYELDGESNLKRIDDLRPAAIVPATSPLRRSAEFTYDELHRLTRARYVNPGNATADRGRIDFAYDGIGNLISQTTPAQGQSGHLEPREDLQFGELVHGGGRSGRSGRGPGDPPGPHAVTLGPGGTVYQYDARGNTMAIGDARLTWDAKGRLVEHSHGASRSTSTYDHAGERVAGLLMSGGQDEVTYWVGPWFEVRPGNAPVKYVLAGDQRIARVKGTLDPTAPRVQRIWLASGWNPVTIAVQASATVESAFGPHAVVLLADGRSFTPIPGAASLPIARALLVLADAPGVVAVSGPYVPPRGSFQLSSSPGYAAWPLLEPFEPAVHAPAGPRLHFFDSAARAWSIADPALPAFLASGRRGDAGGAPWVASPAEVSADAGATADEDIVFYHHDRLGSTVLVTDSRGDVIEETVYAPFGAILAQEQRGTVDAAYRFTGKERDAETGLSYFGARQYAASIGRFLGADPAVAGVEELEDDALKDFLSDPRRFSTYSYAVNNPLKYVDPDGREIAVEEGAEGERFVRMLGEYSGLNLELKGGLVTLDEDHPFRKEGAPFDQQFKVFSLVKGDFAHDLFARAGSLGRGAQEDIVRSLPFVFVDTFKGFEQGSSSAAWKDLSLVVNVLYYEAFPLTTDPTKELVKNRESTHERRSRTIGQEYAIVQAKALGAALAEALIPGSDSRPPQRSAPRESQGSGGGKRRPTSR